MSYTPKGWRKLFPYYWQLAEVYGRRDLGMEQQVHRDVDRAFNEMKMQYLRQAKECDRRDCYSEMISNSDTEAEEVHILLEARGIRRKAGLK